jgi:hypothetical protein
VSARAARAALAAILAAHVLVQAGLHVRGFDATGIDDAYRTFRAWWWWQHPSFTSSDYWLPVPTWLNGLAIEVSGAALRGAPRALAVALSALVVAAVWGIAGGAAEGRRAAALWAAGVAAASPLGILVGMGPLSEPPFVAAVTGGLWLWTWASAPGRAGRAGRDLAVAGAAMVFLAAAGCRYEGWLVAAAWAAWGLARGFGTRLSRATECALAALPLAFPAVWLLYEAGVHGDPFFFRTMIATDVRAAAVGRAALAASVLGWAGPGLALGAFGVWWWARRTGTATGSGTGTGTATGTGSGTGTGTATGSGTGTGTGSGTGTGTATGTATATGTGTGAGTATGTGAGTGTGTGSGTGTEAGTGAGTATGTGAGTGTGTGTGTGARRWRARVMGLELPGWVGVAVLAGLAGPVLAGQVPSQFAPRVAWVVEALGAVPAGTALAALWGRRRPAAIAVALLLAAFAVARPWRFPDGADPRGKVLGAALAAALAPGETAVVEHEDVVFETAFLAAGRPDAVRADRPPGDHPSYYACDGLPASPPPPRLAHPSLLALRTLALVECAARVGGYVPVGEAAGYFLMRPGPRR